MIDFENVKIGGMGKVITGRTPKTTDPEHFGGDVMFIGPTDLHKHFIVDRSEKVITEKGLAAVRSATIEGLSICVGCIGWDMGNVALVEGRCATNQQINSITDIKDCYNPYYIYYWLKGKKDFLFQQASVTRTPILNKTGFSSIEVNIPKNKDLQDGVAHILTTIDKKIALNNLINTELEAMAKLIYDYWFVQFDFPDANGKPYKSSGGKMVYNEALKREIPEGWAWGSLRGFVKTCLGGTPSTKKTEYWDCANILWLNSGEVANFPVLDSELKITQAGIKNSAAELLPKGSVIISIVRHLRVSILSVDSAFNQSVVGLRETETLKCSFLYPYLSREIPRLMTLRTGAQQPHINKKVVDDSSVVIPSNETLKKYYQIVEPILEKINITAHESKKLEELRDWLLPMLMNGQVTVNGV